MIHVREIFQVKFGKIDAAVEHFRRFPAEVGLAGQPQLRPELLTDLSGPMFTLEQCYQVTSLDSWEQGIQATFATRAFEEWFKLFKTYVEDGEREFYRIEQANSGWSGPGAIVVRSCFRALEWRVAEAVDLLKTYGAMLTDCGVGDRPRILTDASGRMFNVLLELETRDLKVWDDHRRGMFQDASFQVWFHRLTGCVVRGSHQFLRVAG